MAGGHVVAGSNPVIPTEWEMIQRSWIIFYSQTCQKHSFCKRLGLKNEIAASVHFPFAIRVSKDSTNPFKKQGFCELHIQRMSALQNIMNN